MFKKKITFKLFIFLVGADVLETLTHFFFKKSVIAETTVDVNNLQGVLGFLGGVTHSPFLWFGLVSVIATFIIWSTILSKIDLSVAVPICSFSYISIPVVSIIFLHEYVSLIRWIGILFILCGVIFVSLSSKEKEAL